MMKSGPQINKTGALRCHFFSFAHFSKVPDTPSQLLAAVGPLLGQHWAIVKHLRTTIGHSFYSIFAAS